MVPVSHAIRGIRLRSRDMAPSYLISLASKVADIGKDFHGEGCSEWNECGNIVIGDEVVININYGTIDERHVPHDGIHGRRARG
jgi:hypothetical protein